MVFGEKVPTGISGDLTVRASHENATEQRAKATELATLVRAELAEKIQTGTATPEEESRFMSMLTAEVAQGYN